MKWNRFSEEVAVERQTVRAYGIDKVMDRCREGDSYKAQALRQLAMRLELEEKLKEFQQENGRLVDQIEAMENENQNLQEKLDMYDKDWRLCE